MFVERNSRFNVKMQFFNVGGEWTRKTAVWALIDFALPRENMPAVIRENKMSRIFHICGWESDFLMLREINQPFMTFFQKFTSASGLKWNYSKRKTS